MTAIAPRLEIKGISRAFGGGPVVDDVSLSVAAGQVTCLLGPSGCGKSTTLRIIAGVDRADQGEVWIDGRQMAGPGLHLPPERRGVGMMFAMVPTNTIALGTLAPDRVKNASGLFNLTRNLGGALGLAIINQVLNERTDLHIARLQERVNWGNATAVETLNMFTQRMQGMGDAAMMAMKQLSQMVHRQAVVMGFGDAFFMLTVFYFGLSLLVMLLDKPSATAVGGDAAH